MLSKRSVRLLKWLKNEDQWMTKTEIQEKCRHFDSRSFDAIVKAKYVCARLSVESDEWAKYRISDTGMAYLEGLSPKLNELRDWSTAIIAIIPFISGVILSEHLQTFWKWLQDFLKWIYTLLT